MNFKSISELVNAELCGKTNYSTWTKTPSQTTTASTWFDLSMSPGFPVPKYWFDSTPLEAQTISQSSDKGIFHGANVAPSEKYLRKLTVQGNIVTAFPMQMIICDYLLYYPSIDDGTTDTQFLTNTITLPRYSDGLGVQMIAVTIASRTGGQDFYVNYTNSDGVSGRTSQTVRQNTVSSVGTITTSGQTINTANPFIGLDYGDKGVRSIDSVTMLGTDVGLFSLILVKPIAKTLIRGIDAPVETDYLIHKNELPIIKDDAYLNFLCLPVGNLSGTRLSGDMTIIWN